ncbi:hypothetical protein ACFRFL_11460 [Streptomyces sp. NPDC056708]|uniref:hypothetical protein n=1 Tax=unclassified Streptomyces TaxID=2593676 RepID=UPI0036B97046
MIQVSLADDLAQTEDGDAKECDGGAHGEGLVVEGAPADRGGAESELPAELVEGGLLDLAPPPAARIGSRGGTRNVWRRT